MEAALRVFLDNGQSPRNGDRPICLKGCLGEEVKVCPDIEANKSKDQDQNRQDYGSWPVVPARAPHGLQLYVQRSTGRRDRCNRRPARVAEKRRSDLARTKATLAEFCETEPADSRMVEQNGPARFRPRSARRTSRVCRSGSGWPRWSTARSQAPGSHCSWVWRTPAVSSAGSTPRRWVACRGPSSVSARLRFDPRCACRARAARRPIAGSLGWGRTPDGRAMGTAPLSGRSLYAFIP